MERYCSERFNNHLKVLVPFELARRTTPQLSPLVYLASLHFQQSRHTQIIHKNVITPRILVCVCVCLCVKYIKEITALPILPIGI